MPCGCLLLAVAGTIVPRIARGFLWIFTEAVNKAVEGWIIPLLGLIFLPYTTLVYVVFYSLEDGSLTWGWVAVIVAALADFSHYFAGAYGRGKEVTVS